MRRLILLILNAFAVGAVVCLVIAGVVLAEGSLRVRRTEEPVYAPPNSSSVQITAEDGSVLRGTFFPQSERCVLVLHGIGDSRLGAAGFEPELHKAGFAVLTPDARGHGSSGGDLITYGVLEQDDVRRWSAWMRREGGCHKVFGLGESLGGASLIMAAAGTEAFDAIVAECSYSDLSSIAAYRVGLLTGGPRWLRSAAAWPLVWSATLYTRLRYGIDLRRASPVEAVRRLRTPLLLIHGLADNRTPPEHSTRILQSAPPGVARLWEIPGAGHTGAAQAAGARFWAEVIGHFGRV